MNYAFVGTHGFVISFSSEVDLTAMTGVRLVVSRPNGLAAIKRDLPGADWNSVGVGGVVPVTVAEGDLSAAGEYQFQIHAQRVNGGNVEQQLASEPFKLNVRLNAVSLPWT